MALRREHWVQAKEAECALGPAPAWVTAEESDLRVFVHDATHPDHEKDYRSLAAFLTALHADVTLYVWRVGRADPEVPEPLNIKARRVNL